jgi:uncharacterized protein YqkB
MQRLGDAEAQGCRGTGIQRHGDAEVRECRTGMQRHRDAEVRGCRGSGVQRHRDAEVRRCELTRLLQFTKKNMWNIMPSLANVSVFYKDYFEFAGYE